jgi:pilus assembly protein CpaF
MAENSVVIEVRIPKGQPVRREVEPGIYSIGSDIDCRIRLSHKDVEGHHAILRIGTNEFWLEDLGTKTGTYIAGNRINGRALVIAGQEIRIGPFILVLNPDSQPKVSPPSAVTAPVASPPGKEEPVAEQSQFAPPSPVLSEEKEAERSIKQQIHRELLKRMDIKRLTLSGIGANELRQKAYEMLRSIVTEVKDRLPPGINANQLIKEIYDEAIGLGPLEPFMEDPTVTEIMVNGPNQIYIERGGKIIPTDKVFMDTDSVMAIIERIVSPIGRRIDESQPYVDARLPDGSRVNAIIPPLSLVGPCLTIRKFSKKPFTDEDLIKLGTMTREIADFCKVCVLLRKNIVVSGGTGTGKTTLLNVLSSYLPSDERIITIEDAAELKLNQVHVVRLEARPPNIEGKGAITIRDLVRNALRMRPDRIVVGECRGGEALDMLQAMNTGHDGSLTTVHANSPRDVISRLETMVLMSGMDLPVRAIREQIASAINLIIHLSRMSDGSRKVVKVTEIVGLEGDQITMQDIFEFKQTGVDKNGRVIGHFEPTGAVPTFIEHIESRGLSIDRSMFDPLKKRDF